MCNSHLLTDIFSLKRVNEDSWVNHLHHSFIQSLAKRVKTICGQMNESGEEEMRNTMQRALSAHVLHDKPTQSNTNEQIDTEMSWFQFMSGPFAVKIIYLKRQ